MTVRLKLVFGLVFALTSIKAQTLNYYFGNLHSHSGYSDGNKDSSSTSASKPSQDYAYAKLSQNFDFLGISEHNHYSSNNNPGMIRTSYALGLAQAAAANTGTFLCLYGMEWGVSNSPSGHSVIYGFNQLIGWEASVPGLVGPNYDIYNDKNDYTGLFRLVKNNPNAFLTLAHPGYNDFSGTASSYNAMYDSAIVGVPFRNGNATSPNATYNTYPASDFFWYYRVLLNRGYHVGMSYDHDNHYLNFGRGNAGRLVIMAPTLTEANLYYAMKNMHFYGSDDWNAKIDFKIGSNIMGDTTSGNTDPTINVIHNDGDGELADSIKIWSGKAGSYKDPVIIAMVKSSNTLSFTDNTIATDDSTKYYLAEIIQTDGQRIITSPIWYKKRIYIGIKEQENNFNFVMFPNPTTAKINLSTGLKENYIVEIFDVSGKKVYSENFSQPDASISTSGLAKGYYNLKLSSETVSKTRKLVIE